VSLKSSSSPLKRLRVILTSFFLLSQVVYSSAQDVVTETSGSLVETNTTMPMVLPYVAIDLNPPGPSLKPLSQSWNQSWDGETPQIFCQKVTKSGLVLLLYNIGDATTLKGYTWNEGTFTPINHTPSWLYAVDRNWVQGGIAYNPVVRYYYAGESFSSPTLLAWLDTSVADMNDSGVVVGSAFERTNQAYLRNSYGPDILGTGEIPIYWPATGTSTGADAVRMPDLISAFDAFDSRYVNPPPGGTVQSKGLIDSYGAFSPVQSVPAVILDSGTVLGNYAGPVMTDNNNRVVLQPIATGTLLWTSLVANPAIFPTYPFPPPPIIGTPPMYTNPTMDPQYQYSDFSEIYTVSPSGNHVIKITGIGRDAPNAIFDDPNTATGYTVDGAPLSGSNVVPTGINDSGRSISQTNYSDGTGGIQNISSDLEGGTAVAINDQSEILANNADGSYAIYTWLAAGGQSGPVTGPGTYFQNRLNMNLPKGFELAHLASSMTDSRLLAGEIYNPMTFTEHPALFIPIEERVVNRDGELLTWPNGNSLQAELTPVYAGKTAGDMVGWKIDIPSSWMDCTFTWSATGSSGAIIAGPSGKGMNSWQISDSGNDPGGNTTLKWNPDSYAITCTISPAAGSAFPVSFQQQVGWRTEDYLVIGQIVPTSTYENSGPSIAESIPFRTAIVLDCNLIPSGLGIGPALVASPLSNTVFGFMEFTNWAVNPHSNTLQGPLSYLGAVTEAHRYWMLENALNISIDVPKVPAQIPGTSLPQIYVNKQYRLFHHFQTKFLLAGDGTIDKSSVRGLADKGLTGPTKFVVTIPAGTFSPYFNSDLVFPVTLLNQDSDSNVSNNGDHIDSGATTLSSYESGRISADGQNVNWRIFGQDVPWIFSEIDAHVGPDHTVTAQIRTSVDVIWQNGAILSGSRIFNNLNIYKAVVTQEQNGAPGFVTYVLQGAVLPMEGQLNSFISSVPLGTWPTPPTESALK